MATAAPRSAFYSRCGGRDFKGAPPIRTKPAKRRANGRERWGGKLPEVGSNRNRVLAHTMGIGGKINRPRTELKKKLFKRRRVLARGGRQQKRKPLRKDNDPAQLWGKRRRKVLKRLRAAARGVPVSPPPATPEPGEARGERPEAGSVSDVEMVEAAAVEGGDPPQQ
ncbi:uncharacterized protein C11orf98 homolog [Neopsephotus bourkii]|uniref:uncharacterized protein C11orf98 homolog n=1 Tax=Neopsephotus bourkii TaxID=309878 RepID=UPI002AA52181|nr:uncharacterized protein C11orf98 homolog [Neopsephotus bourkii]